MVMPRMAGKAPGEEATPGIDSRAKILAALGLIAAVVLTAPMGLAEFAAVLVFVGAVVELFDGSAINVLGRALLVLPLAGAIALFAPMAHLETWSWAGLTAAYVAGWPLILAILSKAYLSVLIVTALTATTPMPDLLRGLHTLRMPDLFLTLFTFLLRYADHFRHQVTAMRDAIASLYRDDSPHVQAETRVYLRDCHDHATQIMDVVEAYREIASSLLDIHLSAANNRMNEVMKVLTIIATIFMPLTFIAGVYGMNFKYMPELEWRLGYPLVLGIMIGLGLAMLWFFRKKKWL